MKTFIIYIILCALSVGCGNYFTRIKYSNKQLLLDASTITLDSTYDYYIRKVYKKEKQKGQKSFAANIDEVGTQKDLIEIEYLLISNKGYVIYLTMIQDRRQMFYAKNYLGDKYLNGFDFRNFLFGKIQNDEVSFTSKDNSKTVDKWKINFNNARDIVTVTSITEMKHGDFEQMLPVELALEKQLGFAKIKTPILVFHEPGKKNDTLISSDDKIHFYKPCHKMRIHFLFKKDPNDDLIIYYKYNRMPYSEKELLDSSNK